MPAATSSLAPLRYSLAALWIGSGVVSLFNDAAGRALLFALPRAWGDALIIAGAACDLALGFALLIPHWLRVIAWLQIGMIVVYTILATLLVPELWLDPLMPLGKNLPILVATLLLARSAR